MHHIDRSTLIVSESFYALFKGWFKAGWWQIPDDSIDCTVDQMNEATSYYFGVAGVFLPKPGSRKPSVAGLVSIAHLLNASKVFETLEV